MWVAQFEIIFDLKKVDLQVEILNKTYPIGGFLLFFTARPNYTILK